MSIKPRIQKLFDEILKEANFPPIHLVTRTEFSKMIGRSCPRNACGQSNFAERIFWVKQTDNDKETKDTIWHELLHCLFPNLPEWWVECAAYKLAKNDYWSYGTNAEKFNRTPANVPSRKMLIEMIKDSSYVMYKRLYG
jgi:hypothetical protein